MLVAVVNQKRSLQKSTALRRRRTASTLNNLSSASSFCHWNCRRRKKSTLRNTGNYPRPFCSERRSRREKPIRKNNRLRGVTVSAFSTPPGRRGSTPGSSTVFLPSATDSRYEQLRQNRVFPNRKIIFASLSQKSPVSVKGNSRDLYLANYDRFPFYGKPSNEK